MRYWGLSSHWKGQSSWSLTQPAINDSEIQWDVLAHWASANLSQGRLESHSNQDKYCSQPPSVCAPQHPAEPDRYLTRHKKRAAAVLPLVFSEAVSFVFLLCFIVSRGSCLHERRLFSAWHSWESPWWPPHHRHAHLGVICMSMIQIGWNKFGEKLFQDLYFFCYKYLHKYIVFCFFLLFLSVSLLWGAEARSNKGLVKLVKRTRRQVAQPEQRLEAWKSLTWL